jgi:hypothetical protein
MADKIVEFPAYTTASKKKSISFGNLNGNMIIDHFDDDSTYANNVVSTPASRAKMNIVDKPYEEVSQ